MAFIGQEKSKQPIEVGSLSTRLVSPLSSAGRELPFLSGTLTSYWQLPRPWSFPLQLGTNLRFSLLDTLHSYSPQLTETLHSGFAATQLPDQYLV
ncbi:MAG: hypothetical protein GY721_03205 [Deltaproteobacteria bacterium]|nr:hypothetical protein [Deltaproteobacteria bacterium]